MSLSVLAAGPAGDLSRCGLDPAEVVVVLGGDIESVRAVAAMLGDRVAVVRVAEAPSRDERIAALEVEAARIEARGRRRSLDEVLARHARVREARQRVLVDWLRLPEPRRPLVPAAPPRAARSADLDRVLREQGAPEWAGKGSRKSRWAVAWDLATAEAEARIDGRWSEATGARLDADGAAVRAGKAFAAGFSAAMAELFGDELRAESPEAALDRMRGEDE